MQQTGKHRKRGDFPIVGIGASAGGLEALELFFRAIPVETKAAYVVISHLAPHRNSLLPELLQKLTGLKVHAIKNRMKVQPQAIYVLPPDKIVTIKKGVFDLAKIASNRIQTLIDTFFESLAEDQGDQCIGIVLSGTGSDGAQGIRTINSAGGLTIAQDPETAKYTSMPTYAINTGAVDSVLPAEKIPEYLSSYFNNESKKITKQDKKKKELDYVFRLLNSHTGHDFSHYKQNTICRRIEKRMNINQINNLAVYRRYLQHNPQELEILFKDFLIGVTSFFRNPEAFDILKEKALLPLLTDKPSNYPVRVWVVGCATGEEVYSLAILVRECLEELRINRQVQIFGTDLDEKSIETARAGIYPSGIATNVSKERLKRFFTEEKGAFKISKEIRNMATFAVQNVIKDPPFMKIDILSCRNLLIYFNANLQKKLLSLFYYVLNDKGILFLGSSESTSNSTGLFTTIDSKWKIFSPSKEEIIVQKPPALWEFNSLIGIEEKAGKKNSELTKDTKKIDLNQLVETILLEEYTPISLIINDREDVVYIHGKAGKYLEPAHGVASLNILQMARPELKTKLSSLLRQVVSQNKAVCYKNIEITENNTLHFVNLKARPFRELGGKENWKLVVIEEVNPPLEVDPTTKKQIPNKKIVQYVANLEQELKQTKETLQTTVEDLETSNEELKSSNEELQSTNEELQSTNEELETSKEELQSLNEEITTVNSELEVRIDDLSNANEDIQSLLYGTEIAAVFLDCKLRIKRFTPKATELINLIQTDIGRPMSDIVSNLKYSDIIDDAKEVLNTLTAKIIEVQNKNGQWYQVRIATYHTPTNRIEGVVLTFSNIHAKKQTEEKVKKLSEMIQEQKKFIDSLKTEKSPVNDLER